MSEWPWTAVTVIFFLQTQFVAPSEREPLSLEMSVKELVAYKHY